MNGPVSQRLWIYFVIMVPLTIVIVGAWLYMDQRNKHNMKMKPDKENSDKAEDRLREIENRAIYRLQKRTLTKFNTGDLQV